MSKINTVGPLEIDASGAIEINSSAGDVNIGNDTDAQDINIGTGAAARLIKVGNLTSSTDIALEIGTGDFSLTSATGLLINQLDSGEMTRPLLPAFLARLGSDDNNRTGAGAFYQPGTNVALTEVYDQGGNFSGGKTFTAPVTGKYQLSGGVRLGDLTSAMTRGDFRFLLSNGSTTLVTAPSTHMTVGNEWALNITALTDMDLGDTAVLSVVVFNGAGNTVDLIASSPSGSTFFAGALVC